MSSVSQKTGGFGEALKEARLKAGFDLRRLSDVTRIQIRYIEALEDEDWGSVPKGVIGRGFVRLLCREIGADCTGLLEKYRVSRGEDPLAHLAHYTDSDDEMDMTYGKEKLPAFGKMFNRGALYLAGIAAVLLVIIGVVLWIWSPWSKGEPAEGKAGKPVAEAAAPPEASAKQETPATPGEQAAQPATPAPNVLEITAAAKTWIVIEGDGIENQKIELAENETRKFETSKVKLTFPDDGAVQLRWNGAGLKTPQKTGGEVQVRFPEDLEALKP
jgi:cytoskeletal protein RodZ